MKIADVDYCDDHFVVCCPFFDNERAKLIPDRKWDKNKKCWRVSVSSSNIRYLTKEYGEEEFTAIALRKIGEFRDTAKRVKNEHFPGWYRFKNSPMDHQKDALNRAWGKDAYAFFHEMGLGKTFTAISLMSAYAMESKIQAMVVICPTPIKHIWPTEIEKHSSLGDELVYVMQPGAIGFDDFMANEQGRFKVLVVGVESLSQGKSYGYAERFMLAHQCGCVLDESSKIKNHRSNRTKAVISLGGLAVKRIMLTGTPITQGIQDLYAQFRFLDWDILGHKSYYTFQNRYCIMGGFENRQIVGYNNMAELLGLVAPYSHTVLKKDALDLPPKVYEKMVVKPTPQQLAALRQLRNEMMAEDNGDMLQVKTALDRLTRFNQICGGMFPYELDFGAEQKEYRVKPIAGNNPKLEAAMDLIENTIPNDASVIIWARFVPEIDMIYDALEELYPGMSVRYYGATSEEDRKKACDDFQNRKIRFFISNQATGGMGLTLTAATYALYFSNSYSFQDRIQSEDRAHRKGQENKVTYVDFVLDVKAEHEIIKALTNKQNVADMVNNNLKSGTFEKMLEV